MNVIHSRCNKAKLDTVPITDGQIIYVKDTHELYFDVNDTRTKATDIIFLATTQEREGLENPFQSKLYFVLEDATLYFYTGNKWVSVTATSADKVSFDEHINNSEVHVNGEDNTDTLLEATDVQSAIKELDSKIGDIGRILDNINGEVV